MSEETFHIPNISCGHCVASIKSELEEIDGVQSVNGNPEQKTVSVTYDGPATIDTIKEMLKEINYPAG